MLTQCSLPGVAARAAQAQRGPKLPAPWMHHGAINTRQSTGKATGCQELLPGSGITSPRGAQVLQSCPLALLHCTGRQLLEGPPGKPSCLRLCVLTAMLSRPGRATSNMHRRLLYPASSLEPSRLKVMLYAASISSMGSYALYVARFSPVQASHMCTGWACRTP